MQDVHSKVTAGAGVANVNMLQQLPHFLMLCGAATERKTGIATLLPGEDVMRLDMANAFFVRYRGREALQRGLKRYEYLFAIMSAFEQWRAVKRCCVVEVKVQFLVLRQSAESARDTYCTQLSVHTARSSGSAILAVISMRKGDWFGPVMR